MSNSEEFEFNKVCRTCLSTTDLKSLYANNSTEDDLAAILMTCTSMKYYENDGLPIQICTKCITELHRSYKFAVKCRETDKKLRHYVQKLVPQIYAIPNCSRVNYERSTLKDPLAMAEIQKELNQEMDVIKNEIAIKNEPNYSREKMASVKQLDIKLEVDSDVELAEDDHLDGSDIPMLQHHKIDIYQLYNSTTKKLSEKCGRGSGRMYHEEWFYKFGVIEKNCKSFCIICNNTVVTRSYNVKRHFQTNHKHLVSLSSEQKNELFSKKLVEYHNQHAVNTRITDLPKKSKTVKASIRKTKPAGSGRQYHADWYCKFGVIEKTGKAFCIICNNTVVSRSYNVKRHFETHHKHLIALTNDERIVYFSQLKELENKFIDSSGDNKQKLPLELVLLN